MTAEHHDSPRGLLPQVLMGAAAILALLGSILYAVFWLPFRDPGDPLPRSIEILPLEREPAAMATEPADKPAYAWIDREQGIVRIPIEQAMSLVVETLPVNEEAANAAAKRERIMIPTDAGSGRFVTRPETGDPGG